MLAFSGCYYGGGEKEMAELGAIRKRWKTLHVRWSQGILGNWNKRGFCQCESYNPKKALSEDHDELY